MSITPETAVFPEQPTRWDWWPLARLLIVLGAFTAFAHAHYGWTPDLAAAATLPRRVFEVLSFFALVSFGLAHLYLIVLMLPLYALVTLNDAFYDATCWVARAILRLRSPLAVAVSGLCGEVALFGAFALAARSLLLRL